MARTFDSKKVIVSVGGNEITGFADGDAIEVSWNSEEWLQTAGIKGDITWNRNNDESGVVTLTLKSLSPSLIDLKEIAKGQATEADAIDVSITDKNTNGEKISGTDGFIDQRAADRSWGEEEGTVEIPVKCSVLKAN